MKVNSNIWTEDEKLQLAEAIDLYGIYDLNKLTEQVPTKKRRQVQLKISQLKFDYRKMATSYGMDTQAFVDLGLVDELFLVSGTKPKETLLKWIDYLNAFYMKDDSKYNKFKLFTKAFLILSECSPELEGHDQDNRKSISFREVYYFLYRTFNDFRIKKNNNESITRTYLCDMLARIVEDITYSSDGEKIEMYNIVKNWTSVNRVKSLRVYGKPEPQTEPGIVGLCLKTNEFKVMHQPMIPSFNPFRMKTNLTDPAHTEL